MRMGPLVVSITSVFCGSVACACTSETEAKRMRAKPSNERITERLPLGLKGRSGRGGPKTAPKTGRMIPPLLALLGQDCGQGNLFACPAALRLKLGEAPNRATAGS